MESGDKASAILLVALASVGYLMPLGLLVFPFRCLAQVRDKSFEARFSSLYDALRTASPIHHLCNCLFTARRLLLVFIAVFFQSSYAFYTC
jgi:hypothetical protein